MHHHRLLIVLVLALSTLAACGGSDAPTSTPVATAPDGERLFVTQGCATCHGNQGEGASGPAVIHHSEAQVIAKVREPSGVMPSFDSTKISDAELAAIAAFIAGLDGDDHGHQEPDHGDDHAH
jgi:mono/diheme cytochrome c family protein